MISEDLLERGLNSAADDYDVPAPALDQLRESLTPEPKQPRRVHLSHRAWAATAAAAVVALVAVAVAIGGGGSSNGNSAATSAPDLNGSGTNGAVAQSRVGGGPAFGQDKSVGGGTIGGGTASGTSGTSTFGGAAATGPGALAAVRPPATAQAPSVVPGGPGARIVKTGEMDLQVDKGKVGHTIDRLIAIGVGRGGYVSDSHTDEGVDPSGSVTLRVPVNAFEATVQDVRTLPAKVTSQQTSGQDVTSKYVDLQARLHALQATRTTYERLLAQASTIGDILSVQSRITDVQTQIEQLQGQIRVLGDQTSLGTLTVTVDQKTAPAPVAHHQSGMSRAFHRSVDRFVNGIEGIVGVIGPLLLVVLLVGLALLIGRVGYRLLRRQLV